MANDPVRKDVLDRAKVKLAFPGVMFGDVGQPNLVRSLCFEVMPDPAMVINGCEKIVMNRRAGPAGLALLSGVRSPYPTDPAKPVNPVLRTLDPFVFEFIGEEPVTQGRVILVEVVKDVDDFGVVPLTLRDRSFEPFVIPLGREPKDPARHRDRHPDSGTGRSHLTDERENYFPGRFAWER